jgi:hypothetical protein
MTSKFEQLIEYVINDEEAKAKELFHDIVVEKSREIYETLMNEEEMCDHCHKDPCECDDEEEDLEEGMEEDSMGGASSEDLIDDVESEEAGMPMHEDDEEFDDEAEEDGEDMTHDMEKDHDADADIEDRVIDLEDKLDELMAEFEAMMGQDNDGIDSDLAGEEGDELAGDALAQDDTEAFADNDMDMMENVTLDKVPAPKHGDDGANNKSPTNFNSGAKGMAASPVKMTGDTAQGRPAPKATEVADARKFKNNPGTGTKNSKLEPAPKPTFDQHNPNTRTPFPKG